MHTIFTTQSTPPRATFIDCIVCLSVNDLSSLFPLFFFLFFLLFFSFLPFPSRPSFTPITDISACIDYASGVVQPTCYYRSRRIETRGWNVDVPVFSTRIARFFFSRSFQFQPILRSEKSRAMPLPRLVFEETGKGFEQDDVEFSRHANGARWIFMAIVCRSFAPFLFFNREVVRVISPRWKPKGGLANMKNLYMYILVCF